MNVLTFKCSEIHYSFSVNSLLYKQKIYTFSKKISEPTVVSLKLPFASPSIQSLIRQVVNLRLKSINKSWMTQNPEILLHGRCQ